ncbi:MAG TPA: hypothetical protein DDZ51_25705 [Planctomycetaceae bacterium]|nr:hypothetical protein [Planctomycetaceae bacterium]
MIRLFTSLYPEKSETRRNELLTCLERNLANPAIGLVCLFLEGVESSFPFHEKLKVRSISHRPMYQDFFDWANELVQLNTDTSIITNSDIYFDHSIIAIAKSMSMGQCAALSRWNLGGDGSFQIFDRNDSQDVWVFKGKIRPVVSDYLMGVPRCDNRLLHELRRAGYEVSNPAFSVRAFHLHAGERTEYPENIDGPHVEGPYEYFWPHNLMSLPATVLHNMRHPDAKLGWRIDWRKLQRTLSWRVFNKVKLLVARNERREIRS